MAQRSAQIRQALAQSRPVAAKPKAGIGNARAPKLGPAPGQGWHPGPESPNTAYARGQTSTVKPVNALPWDSLATLESAGGQRKEANTLSSLASEKDFKEHYYGLDPGYDVNNPYSQAALLESQHINARRGDVNSAGNQLYAGSTINHLRQADNRYGQSLNALKLQQQQDLSGIEGREAAAREIGPESNINAQTGAIERFEKTPVEPQAKKKVQQKSKGGKGKRK